jgi:CheY-like chemotaxis protein
MKLEYNILWIDNDLQEYIDNGSVKDVEVFLNEKGFDPIIEKVFDESKIDKYLDKNYDLIISDFNLNKVNGDVVIYNLRQEKKIDTEILFYSARINFRENKEVKERLAFMERINIQYGRDGLIEKIEKVIELTLKKMLELNSTRGLITAATSELDIDIEEIYYHLIECSVDEHELSIIKKIFKTDFYEIKRKTSKDIENKEKASISDHKEYFRLSDSFRKYDLLKELLKIKKIDGFDLDLFRRYKSEVIDIRNKFAHAKSIINEKGVPVALKGKYGESDFEFTEQNCISIRKNLIKQKQNIEELKKMLEIN